MKRKRMWYGCLALTGGLLFVLSLLLGDAIPKQMSGLLTGVGCGLLAGFGVQWRMQKLEEKNPDLARKSAIESKDERNVVIRNRSKAAAGDIVQWCILGAAYLTIAIGSPLWVTLTTIGIFLLYNILALCFMVKYQKEM